MMIIIVLIISEFVFSSMLSVFGWDFYAVCSEARAFLLLLCLFSITGRASILTRSAILFFCLCQAFTASIYILDYFEVDTPSSFLAFQGLSALLTMLWVVGRVPTLPAKHIDISMVDKTKSYVLVKKPSAKSDGEVALSFFGQASAVSVYAGGVSYSFDKDTGVFDKGPAKLKASRYAIEINCEPRIIDGILASKTGSKYNMITNNCVSVCRDLWRHIGINLKPHDYLLPGCFVSKLCKV